METTTSAELKIKYESLKDKWGQLEKQLIEKIASTENEGLMDLFTEWQTLRNELNDTVKLSWEAVLREQPKQQKGNGFLCGSQGLGESSPPKKSKLDELMEWVDNRIIQSEKKIAISSLTEVSILSQVKGQILSLQLKNN